LKIGMVVPVDKVGVVFAVVAAVVEIEEDVVVEDIGLTLNN